MPKFEKYNGHGDPIAHLKRYCNQLRGAGGKEELLMAYLGESLTGIASEWYIDQDISHWHIWDDLARDFVRQFQYNIDIAPDRNSLTNFKKKIAESFREYAIKWHEQAARVKPPLDETEMVNVFLQAQEADYFQNMMSAMGKPFAEAIKIREMVENGLKTGRIISQSALRATSQAIQNGSGGLANRKKREEGAMMASGLRGLHRSRDHSYLPSRTPQYYYPHQDATYAMAPPPYAVMNAQPYTRPQQHYNQNRAPPPRNNHPYQAPYNPRPPQNNYQHNTRPREHPRRNDFTPIGESYSSLFPKLVQMGLLQLVPPNRQNPESPSYRPGTRCAYHSAAEGHDMEDCWTLKRAVENLIEQKRVVLRDEEVPNMTNNSLPAHNNRPVIGMICDDKEFYPALKAIIAIADSEARPKAAAKQARNEKKITPTPQVAEKAMETNTGAAPAKDAILYVPRAPRKEQLMLNTPKRFEQRKVTLNVLKLYVPKGTYVARGPVISPRLTEPVVISRAPQSPMRDPITVPWNYSKTMVTYKGKEIMGEVNEMNQPRKYHNPEEQKKLKLSKDKRFSPKKPVSAEEAEEFFRKMKTSEYAIIDQLRKTPSQVSLLSLFISSNEHQKVLLKTLNEAYVPVETSVEQLERMAERFFEVNRISFSRDDLPQEGAAHNKALHLTVKCEGYYMKRVMLDGGSGVNIFPLSMLQRMKIGT
ncbi:uncharacterized protein [Nicotiana tomentosiformis]|uniref:uncharacterized protein n=1 Tax=Nicotiana tomentosiformis TaxID=4098 RepID=UPI00388C8DC3